MFNERIRYKAILSIVFLLVAMLYDWLHFLLLLAVTGPSWVAVFIWARLMT